MNEEEKEAIELLEAFEPDDIVECALYRRSITETKNYIEKLQKENEELKNYEYIKALIQQNNDLKDRIWELQKELDKKDKVINGHIRDKKELSERMINTLKQIEFKDKVIDLMAEEITYMDYIGKTPSKKHIKERFYKKAEEEE